LPPFAIRYHHAKLMLGLRNLCPNVLNASLTMA
jgi:hypothetical protein